MDTETGGLVSVDSASLRFRERFADDVRAASERRQRLFRRMDVETIELVGGESFVEPLRRYFHRRHARR